MEQPRPRNSELLVEEDFVPEEVLEHSPSDLSSWIMTRVNRWRQYRDSSFKDRWDEYYRIFRGRWHSRDKSRTSERSRLVNPALASALEQTVAEMEEATFGREVWIDVQDKDRENTAVLAARDSLLHDIKVAGGEDAVAESYLNGALFGQLIMKLVVEPFTDRFLEVNPDTQQPELVENQRVMIYWEALEASEFVPDPSGRNIDEMLGMAHEVLRPLSWVEERQAKGIFDPDVVVYSWEGGTDPEGGDKQVARGDLEQHITNEDSVLITEYHGLVPAHMLPRRAGDDLPEELADNAQGASMEEQLDALIDQTAQFNQHGEEMVEAIVTIANKNVILKAERNPFLMQDRGFIAAQFEKVPGRFWGRGVMEKGYNPHKALDAELRARADALALISNPMMGVDATRLPRGFDLRVRPGKTWITNGAPKDILQPVAFSGLEPSTFNQSGELLEMINSATGALDLNQMVKAQGQGQSGRPNASHSSMVQGAFIKRAKRAMQNVSRKFLEPMARKTLWRYMQFEPARYPTAFDFRIIGTMGIMAREFEQTQLTQLMGQIPDEMQGPKLLLLQSIVDNSSSNIKGPLVDAIKAELEKMNSEEAQQEQQYARELEKAQAEAALAKEQAEAALIEAKIEETLARAYGALIEGGLKDEELNLKAIQVAIDARKTQLLENQNRIAAFKAQTERNRNRSKD